MHGVPLILVMDPGAANKGLLMRNLARTAGIELIHHAPGAARVTGSVEKTHDLVRMHFETLFRFRDPREVTLEKLNADVQAWAAYYCATRKHSRHGQTRYGAWMAILAEQLRTAASLEVLRECAVGEPQTRRVDNDRCVSFGSKTYDLTHVPGVVAGLKVTLQVNVFRDPSIDVLFTCPDTGAETWHVVPPVTVDRWGFREGAPVWGERPRQAANSEVDEHRNELLKTAYALPTIKEAELARKQHAQAFEGVVDAMAHVNAAQVPTYLPRRTTELAMPERKVEARRLSVAEACLRLLSMMGKHYTPQVPVLLDQRFAEGVPEEALEGLAAELLAPAAATTNVAPLRAAGGEA